LLFLEGRIFLNDEKKGFAFSGRLWLLPLLFAFLIPLIAVFMPDSNMQRSLQTRRVLFTACLQNLFSARQYGFITGYGPSAFHEHSGTFMPPETRKMHMSRNQFHPHNDLLYYWYSYGLTGLLLRLLLYALILKIVFRYYRFLPLLFFLLQIQFSPDALSLPAGGLFFFFVGQSAVCVGLIGSGRRLPENRPFALLRPLLFVLLTVLCFLPVYSQFFYSQAVNGGDLPRFQPFYRSPALDYNYAVRKFRDGKLTETLKMVQEIKKRAPHFQDIDYLSGLTLAKLNREPEAVTVLREKIRIDPYLLESWLLLSDILINTDNLAAACALLDEGGSLFPHEPLFAKKLSSFCSH
jgi:tetratricopeptide (TPR) repeat protein